MSWGDGLVVGVFHYPGGLKAVTEDIHEAVGLHVGVRNTFAKLLRVEDPAELPTRDHFRAWLLVTALGENPEEWGVSNKVVPTALDIEQIRTTLTELRACRDSNPKPSDLYPPTTTLGRPLTLVIGQRDTRLEPDPETTTPPERTARGVVVPLTARTRSRNAATATGRLATVHTFGRREVSA